MFPQVLVVLSDTSEHGQTLQSVPKHSQIPPRRLQDGSHNEVRDMFRSSGDFCRFRVDVGSMFNRCWIDFGSIFDWFSIEFWLIVDCFFVLKFISPLDFWLILILNALVSLFSAQARWRIRSFAALWIRRARPMACAWRMELIYPNVPSHLPFLLISFLTFLFLSIYQGYT